MALAEIIGPDLLIIFLIFALLFGSSQLPKLARSVGQASREFRQGLLDGSNANVDAHPGQQAGGDHPRGSEPPKGPGSSGAESPSG